MMQHRAVRRYCKHPLFAELLRRGVRWALEGVAGGGRREAGEGSEGGYQMEGVRWRVSDGRWRV